MKLKPIFAAMLSAALLLIAIPNAFVAAATTATGTTTSPAPTSSSTTTKQSMTNIVNINTADAATLQTLDGIGPKRAAAIIAYRQQNGPFQYINDLSKVKDVGTSVIAKNQSRIVVG